MQIDDKIHLIFLDYRNAGGDVSLGITMWGPLQGTRPKCYMKSDFLKMERIMLRVLEWNIQTPMIHNLVREVALIQNLKPVDEDFLTQIIGKIIFHKSLAYMPPSKLAFTLISASDKFEVQDVEKAFKYLLYLLKQDPDETDDDINY